MADGTRLAQLDYHHQPHLDSIETTFLAFVDSTSALRRSFTTLASSLAESQLLINEMLNLLPPLTNHEQSHAEPEGFLVAFPKIDGPDLLNQMPDQLVTVTAAGDRHPAMSEEILESVEPDPVLENDEFIPTPHPNSMIARYEDYSVCSFVVSTLPYSSPLRFPFCNFSIVAASESLGISTEFERCFMSSILRDRWGLFLQPACLNFKLFDPALWVMRPTHDLGESKAFDPGVADHPFDANQLIANDVCVVLDFNSVLVVIAYGLTKKVSSIDSKQDLIFTAGVSYTPDATILRQFDLVWQTRFGERADVDDLYIVDVQRVLQMDDFNRAGLWVTSSDYNAANLGPLRDFADKILDSMLPLLGVMRPNHGFDDCKSFDPGIYEYLLTSNRSPANKLSVALVRNDKISTGIFMHVGTSPFYLFSVMFRKPLIHGNEDMVEAIDEYVVGQLKDFAGMTLVFALTKVSRLAYTEDEQTMKEILKEKFEGLSGKQPTVPFFALFSAAADRVDHLLMFLGSAGACIHGAALPVFFILFGRMIDSLGHLTPNSHGISSEVSKNALYLVYLGTVLFASARIGVAFWMQTGERQTSRLCLRYLQSVPRKDMNFFDTAAKDSNIIFHISSDAILVQDAIGDKIGHALRYLSHLFVGFVVGLASVWQLTLLTLAVVPLIAVAGGAYTVIMSTLSEKGETAYAEAGKVAEEVISQIRTVYSFVGEDKAIQGYSKSLDNAYNSNPRIWHIPWDSFAVKYSSGYALVETLMLEGMDTAAATWKPTDKFRRTYSDWNLEDKVVFAGVSNVTSLTLPTAPKARECYKHISGVTSNVMDPGPSWTSTHNMEHSRYVDFVM